MSGIHSDAEGTLWAAADAGLLRLRDGRLTMLTSANGLPCAPPVWWVTEDDDRSLWLSLNCGVARIRRPELEAWAADTKRTVAVTIFDDADGVRQRWNPSKGYRPMVTKSKDGKVWFIGLDGVGVIDPRRLSHNGLPPPVHIERIAANGKLYWQNLTAMAPSSLALPPLIRDLEIEYTAMSLAVPEKADFVQARRPGRTGRKSAIGGRRSITNLDPGNYRFRVIAATTAAYGTRRAHALDFSVAPAYWQTRWFRVLCVVLVLAAAVGALSVARAAARARIRHDARRPRGRAHAHRARPARHAAAELPRGAAAVPDRVRPAAGSPGEAKQVLASAIDQAAEAITEGRDAVQGLRASATETNDLADSIRALGEELASENGSEVVAAHRSAGHAAALHPIVRDEVFRIAGEAMRNAFRHAGAKQIEVELRYDERQLRVRVRDDGKGIDPEVLRAEGREGQFGLRGMRERAKLIGGKLTVWSGLDAGTEVELSIPAPHAYSSSAPPIVARAEGLRPSEPASHERQSPAHPDSLRRRSSYRAAGHRRADRRGAGHGARGGSGERTRSDPAVPRAPSGRHAHGSADARDGRARRDRRDPGRVS